MAQDMTPGSRTTRADGFTLIELLVVLLIIGLLAAFVAPNVYQRIKPAKRTVAESQLQSFMSALDAYYIDTGRFPATQEGLEALHTAPAGVKQWRGPYLKRAVPKDPWGNRYVYRSPGRNGPYEILSFGADGREGGNDDGADITSWSSE